MADNRSFLDIVNGARAPSHGAPRLPANDAPRILARLRAFAVSPSWFATASVAVVAVCVAVYGTIGSVHNTRVAASRAAAPRVDIAAEAKPQAAISEPAVLDRAVALVVALAPVDSRPPDARLGDPLAADTVAMLRADDLTRSGELATRLWTRIGTRETEAQFDRLAADYAELVGERDQLRERVKELEQALSSLQVPPGSPQAKALLDNSFGASSGKPGAAVIAFPGVATAGASAEQPRPVLKNFTTPGSAPNYFTDESGAVLGNHATAPAR